MGSFCFAAPRELSILRRRVDEGVVSRLRPRALRRSSAVPVKSDPAMIDDCAVQEGDSASRPLLRRDRGEDV